MVKDIKINGEALPPGIVQDALQALKKTDGQNILSNDNVDSGEEANGLLNKISDQILDEEDYGELKETLTRDQFIALAMEFQKKFLRNGFDKGFKGLSFSMQPKDTTKSVGEVKADSAKVRRENEIKAAVRTAAQGASIEDLVKILASKPDVPGWAKDVGHSFFLKDVALEALI